MVIPEKYLSVCIGFPVDINVEFSIFSCNYGDKEYKFSIVFMLEGELYSVGSI